MGNIEKFFVYVTNAATAYPLVTSFVYSSAATYSLAKASAQKVFVKSKRDRKLSHLYVANLEECISS